MTSGERRLARQLEAKLEDDYLCWYDARVGTRGLHPDFIILHPRRGILILEVKDWKLDSIKELNRSFATLLTSSGLKNVSNPLEQARQYAYAVSRLLEGDPSLTVPRGERFQGKLFCPYGYGVVLSSITRKVFESTDLSAVLETNRVICKDEIMDVVSAEAFQERLWSMFTVYFPYVLTLPQIERIRWHLFPQIRINPGQLSILDESSEKSAAGSMVPDLMRVMDLQQEQLARSLGEGHRVIHGVAGAGKTLILGYRCFHLAGLMNKPILVLCYNVSLAAKLAHMVEEKDLGAQVRVRNFHAWCSEQLNLYHARSASPLDGTVDRFDRIVQQVIEAVERGQIPGGQYGAVMIDEGHDFRPEWLKLVAQMVDDQTNSLLVLYDDAQSIYSNNGNRKFSFASVGIEARGRTTILRLNYRNTAEVLAVAYEFAKEILTPQEAEDDGVPLVQPESAGRHGPVPEVVRLPSFRKETDYLLGRLKMFNEDGMPWNRMAVIYRNNYMGKNITRRLRETGIPVAWLNEDRHARRYDPNEKSVKVMTMHSSKGLEFPVVAIPGIGYMPHVKEDAKDEARLLYVAMTRAMNNLILTSHRDSDFSRRVGKARERIVA